jgi:hypothetical protein
MKKLVYLAVTGLILAALSVPADAQVSFDGKATSFHTATAIPLPGSPGAPILVGTIAKGKKKKILEINAMITSEDLAPGAPWTLNLYIDVNGVSADPTLATPPGGAVQDCGSDTFSGPYSQPVEGCTVSGTWLLDLDAAELANPGVFIKQPLTVTMYGGVGTNPGIAGIPASASLSVKMLKKK